MNKCPICGSELKETIVESSLLIKCQECDYSVVTTHINPIYEDNTVYTLALKPEGEVNKKTVAEIKRMKNVNTPDAIKLLKNGVPEFYTGNAEQTKDVRDALDSVGIAYAIVPSYKW